MANNNASLSELTVTIAKTSAALQEYLHKNNLQGPSFTDNAHVPDYLPNDEAIEDIRYQLVQAARILADLVSALKQLFIEKTTFPVHEPWTLQIISDYGIAQHVPFEGSITYPDLSTAVGLETSKLRPVLRFAMLNHFFHEPTPDHVAHTSLSRMITTDQSAADWLSFYSNTAFHAAARQVEALQKWSKDPDQQSTMCGMALTQDGKPFFQWLGEDSTVERVRRFKDAMRFVGSGAGRASVTGPLAGFDWHGLGKAKVVDVGGSTGHISTTLARTCPDLKFVVQDLPEVVKDLKVPLDLEGRLSFGAYDFMKQEQPITDGDVFFFRKVFHDWSDEDSTTIIQNTLEAMKEGARLIVNEHIVPDPGELNAGIDEKTMRALDLQMMMCLNARERSLEEWRSLFEGASGGRLKFEGARRGVMSFLLCSGE